MKLKFCAACGDAKSSLEYHHLIPKSEGGTDDETNLLTLCFQCHGKVHGMVRRDIKKLTKAGLERAKARGVKLGSPNPGAGGRKTAEWRKNRTKSIYMDAFEIIKDLHSKSVSLRDIALELESRKVTTAMGKKKWAHTSVKNLILDYKNAGLLD
jgi:DNA invertase Pin-like site-specific DNA recombinase